MKTKLSKPRRFRKLYQKPSTIPPRLRNTNISLTNKRSKVLEVDGYSAVEDGVVSVWGGVLEKDDGVVRETLY